MEASAIRPVKYVVCVDASEESMVALKLASAKAQLRRGMVDMLHVVVPADFQSLPGIAERMQQEQRAEAERLMQDRAAAVHAATGITPSIIFREGPVGDEILNATMEDYDASVLVLGVAVHSAGRGKLVSWLATQLGSKLLIPLLLVPGNLTDQQMETLV